MSGLVKEGFLLTKILTGNTSHPTPHIDWNRRWFELYRNGILKCYDSCYADHQVFSLHVSVNDLMYPYGMSGKPWIISVGMRERGEKLLLEADCEECMERWAELMTQSVSTESSDIRRDVKSPLKPIVSPKPKLQPFHFDQELSNKKPHHRSATELDQPAADIPLKHPLASQLSPHQEDYGRSHISIKIYDDVVSKKNKPELTYSDYISLGELRNALDKRSLINKLTSPIIMTRDRNFIPVKPPGKQVIPISRLRSVSDATSIDKATHKQKEYFEFTTKPPQDSVFLKAKDRAFVTPSSESSKVKFQNSLPKCQQLLNDFWIMFFLLPNGKVYKQLIDLTLPIQATLRSFLNCFDHSYTSPNAYLIIQVVGDLYQTYNVQKSSREKKKVPKFLCWKMSFSSQGVVTSKIVRIKLRVDAEARLNSNKLNEYLYEMNHLSESDLFCMSWISFVKGNFPVLDPPVSAFYSACLFLIYNRVYGRTEDIEVKQFVPSHLQKFISHLSSIQQEIRTMKYSDTLSMCRVFLDNLNGSRSGNAISMQIVKFKKLAIGLKYINCIFVIGKYHIGITRVENESDYATVDTFSEFWHFSEIMGWYIQPENDIVFIQLKSDMDSSDNLVFFSNNVHFIDFIFCQYLGTRKM